MPAVDLAGNLCSFFNKREVETIPAQHGTVELCPLAVPAARCLEQASQHGGQMVAAHVSVLLFRGGTHAFPSIHLCISNINSPSTSVFSASSLLADLGLKQRCLSPQGQGHHMAHFQPQRPNSLLRLMLGHGCPGRDWMSGRTILRVQRVMTLCLLLTLH